jgi:lipopolysaccharide biosynthesis protein
MVLHCFYFDLIEEFARVIKEVRRSQELDVFVSFPSVWSLTQVEAAVAVLEPRKAYIVENHGRDVYPFLVVGREALADGYTFGCKVHSKKSTHRQDGSAWRSRLLEGLLSHQAFARLRSGMFDNSRVGLAAPAKAFMSLGVEEYVASNLDHMNVLIRRFDLNPNFRRGEFVAGTMFWFRFEAMQDLFENACNENDFGFDLGQVDGTLAHAWERLFVLYCVDKGWVTMKLP